MPHSTDSQPTTGNPAAERLRDLLIEHAPAPLVDQYRRAVEVHERRATVDPERLALALRAVYGHYESSIGVALIRAQDVIRQYEALDATASEEEARHG